MQTIVHACMHDIVYDSGNKKIAVLKLHNSISFHVCTCNYNHNNGVETILNLHHSFTEASEHLLIGTHLKSA